MSTFSCLILLLDYLLGYWILIEHFNAVEEGSVIELLGFDDSIVIDDNLIDQLLDFNCYTWKINLNFIKYYLRISQASYIQVFSPPSLDYFSIQFVVTSLTLGDIPLKNSGKNLAIGQQNGPSSVFLVIWKLPFVVHPSIFNAG